MPGTDSRFISQDSSREMNTVLNLLPSINASATSVRETDGFICPHGKRHSVKFFTVSATYWIHTFQHCLEAFVFF